MAEKHPQPAAKTPRWIKVLLALSLALNLLIIGAVAGLVATGGGKAGAPRFDLAGPIARAMDETRRDRIRDALREANLFERSSRRQIRADRQVLLDAIRADDFDVAAFRDALVRQRDRLQAAQVVVLDAVAEEVSAMSIEERVAFADRLEEQMRRVPRGPGRPRDGG